MQVSLLNLSGCWGVLQDPALLAGDSCYGAPAAHNF